MKKKATIYLGAGERAKTHTGGGRKAMESTSVKCKWTSRIVKRLITGNRFEDVREWLTDCDLPPTDIDPELNIFKYCPWCGRKIEGMECNIDVTRSLK